MAKKLTLDDVNTILKSPYKDVVETLLALVKLDNREKQIIDMFYFQGLKQKEISDSLGIAERTIQYILKRIRIKLLKVWNNNATAMSLVKIFNKK